MKAHDLIDGRRVSLAELNAREQAFLTDLQRMARQGVSYFEVYRTAVGPGSPALQGRNRIDRRIVGSPLYLVARDIATRVGIRQGLVLAPEHQNETAKAPKDAARKRSGVPGSPRATGPGSGAEPRMIRNERRTRSSLRGHRSVPDTAAGTGCHWSPGRTVPP